MKKKRFTAAQLITIHQKVLANTAYHERDRRQRLSYAIQYFDDNEKVFDGGFSVK